MLLRARAVLTLRCAGKRVLDLGCNAGQITWAVAAEGAKLTLGVPWMHQLVKRIYRFSCLS